MRYGLRLPSFALGAKTATQFSVYSGMDLDYWRTYYLLGQAEELAERIGARIDALDGGVDTIVLNPLNWSTEQLELIAGEVLPRVKVAPAPVSAAGRR